MKSELWACGRCVIFCELLLFALFHWIEGCCEKYSIKIKTLTLSGAPWQSYLDEALLHFRHFGLMCHQEYIAKFFQDFLCKLNQSCFWLVQCNMEQNTMSLLKIMSTPQLYKLNP